MSCCTSTTQPTASTADPPGDPVWRMAPGLRKPRLRPASAASGSGRVQPRPRPAPAASSSGCVSPGPPRRKPHLTRNVHGSHPSMHVFSLGRFCASPKPSPRGEDAELCSPDAVEASRPLRRRRSRAASCVISCFQSSMLLRNLSSTFSLEKKASQRALRSSRVLLRTIATAHPAAASPHHAAPRPAVPHHAAPRLTVPHHAAPRPTVPHHVAPRPADPHHTTPRLTVPHHTAPRPTVPHHAAPRPAASPHHVAPQPAVPHHAAPQPVNPHHATPRPTVPHHVAPRPVVPHHFAPRPTVPHHAAPRPVVPHRAAPRPADPHHVAPRSTVPHHTTPRPAVPHHVAPRLTVPHHAAPRCGRFSTDFSQSFPHFCRFPTAAFFPLGFLRERQGQIF